MLEHLDGSREVGDWEWRNRKFKYQEIRLAEKKNTVVKQVKIPVRQGSNERILV